MIVVLANRITCKFSVVICTDTEESKTIMGTENIGIDDFTRFNKVRSE